MLAKNIYKENYVTINPAEVVVGEMWVTDTYYNVYQYTCGHKYYECAEQYPSQIYIYGDGSWGRCHTGYILANGDIYCDTSSFGKHIKSMLPKEEIDHVEEIYVDMVCEGCQEALSHKNDLVNHGLQAFCKGDVNDINSSIKRIDDILENPEWEICCSNKSIYIGPIGITGHGNVTAYFPIDVYSKIDENTSERYISEIGTDRLSEYRKFGSDIDHDEYFVKTLNPTAIWVKEWYWERLSPDERRVVKNKAQALNIELVFVEKRHV